MGNAQQPPRVVKRPPFCVEYTPTPVSGVVANVTPGAPTAGDLPASATTVIYTVPVLKKNEALLTRVIVKLVPPEGEGWKLYEKSYGDVYNRHHTNMYWSRELKQSDFADQVKL
jgi:hypothetical protein